MFGKFSDLVSWFAFLFCFAFPLSLLFICFLLHFETSYGEVASRLEDSLQSPCLVLRLKLMNVFVSGDFATLVEQGTTHLHTWSG